MHHYYNVKYIKNLDVVGLKLIITPASLNKQRIFKVSYDRPYAPETIYFSLEKAKEHIKNKIISTVKYFLEKNIYKEEPLLEILSNIEKHGVDFYEN